MKLFVLVFLTLAASLCISIVGSQSIGTVRCYVCKSNQFTGIRFSANCPDIYNTTTTTITYCRACLKYVGNFVAVSNNPKPIVSRGCYDEEAYNANKTGVFQQSSSLERTSGDFTITDGMAVSGRVIPKNGRFYIGYGTGELYVCNDQDICNSATRHRETVGKSVIFPIFYFIIKFFL